MVKKPTSPTSACSQKLLDQKLDAFVRALAIEAAREDHREALKQARKRKGGRPRKTKCGPRSS
jgi:hypothetical protein